jgi:NADH-quinone oxidoreductase subunit E
MGFKSLPMTNVAPTPDKDTLFTPEIRARIDRWVARYPEGWQQSAVMAALRIVQETHEGSLTNDLMDKVAAYLDLPPIAVYEVATFYSMYELKPVGRHKICVCASVSCMLGGCDDVIHHLEKKFGVRPGEVTPDGKFSIKEVECLGACGGAPVVQIGKDYYENLTIEELDKLIEGLE